jgi:hypothetical protein
MTVWWFPRGIRFTLSTSTRLLRIILQRGTQSRASRPSSAVAVNGCEWDQLWADVGTNVWRLRRTMLEPGTDAPRDEMRRAYRHLESIWHALTESGIEIQDHTGMQVPENGILGLKILAFQPADGILCETVIETVKPSIYCKERYVQVGEVIVGTPRCCAAAEGEPRDRTSSESEAASELSDATMSRIVDPTDISCPRSATPPEALRKDHTHGAQIHVPDHN